jgi:signal transduction histidine kinase/DNA-binding response OmpR family regulator
MHPPLTGVNIVDLLEFDPRPSFIVALPTDFDRPTVIYSNPALSIYPALLEILLPPSSDSHANFWEWIRGSQLFVPRSLAYLNLYWTRNVVHNKWVIVGANDHPPSDEPPRKIRLDSARESTPVSGLPQHESATPTPTAGSDENPEVPRLVRSATDPGLILPDFMPEQESFLDVVNSANWAGTPLGPMDSWPERLHQTFSQVIADSRPIAMYWGPQYITIYNEAFSKLCGSKHPGLLGKPAAEAWPDGSRRLEETMRSVATKQRASMEDESRFFVPKYDGAPQEIYLKWSVIPILQNGECLGFMHPVLETTSMRLWERRMKMLIDLGDVLVTARDIKSYWRKTIEELTACEPTYDIPLAILYSVEDDSEGILETVPKYNTNKICRLEGALGVPSGHPIMPDVLRLKDTNNGLAAKFREALRTPHPVLIQTRDGSLPERLLGGIRWRGFGDPCRAAVICPIRPTKEENVMGLLLLGLNPRRPYDNDYRQYISLLSQKLTTSLASTVLLEEETRRGRNAADQAAYDQAMLKEKLAFQTREATESEQRFKAVAEFIPVGMCFGDVYGNISFANDAWYRITGHPAGSITTDGFLSCVFVEDQGNIARAYEELQNVRSVSFEFRVKRREDPSSSQRRSTGFKNPALAEPEESTERHVLALAKAERELDGTIIRILTCLTDVTAHKQTAEEAMRRAQQAENLKRMAEFATVGMYDMDLSGRLLGANNVFYEMCGLEKVDLTRVALKPWETCVVDEDLPILKGSLRKLAQEGRSQTAEIRLKTPWIAEDSHSNKVVAPRWVLATFMPVKSSDTQIQSFTGCLSDVSLQRWQLERERQRKDEAIESKRQQDNFIDMTSHEMRNPLSAIIHCADAIIASLAKAQDLAASHPLAPGTASALRMRYLGGRSLHEEEKRLITDGIENAETIIACAQHQKRIVDDILTMSKLDSKLLAVTPFTVNPIQIVQDALKMFEVEARRVDIDLSMVVDKSFHDLGLQYLDFDPSRVKQVLINLLTNALKFTKLGPTRNVSVLIKASRNRPTDSTSSVQFIPRSIAVEAEYEQPALKGRTNGVFLTFEVKDTGQGLTDDEKRNLFNKFVQASSRTHVKYGGSGLGLFISRRLTELQNGAIGVSSMPGVGSTFAFFIEAYVPTDASRKEAESAAAAIRDTTVTVTTALPGKHGRAGLGAGGDRIHRSGLFAPLSGNPRLDGILIVEDNLINQQITRRGLQDRGFTVDVANHGVEALEKLMASISLSSTLSPPTTRNSSLAPGGDTDTETETEDDTDDDGGRTPSPSTPMAINLILMDIEMPIQDGLTCTRKIRELESRGQVVCALGGRIPIIAVSANARMEQVLEAKAAGCDDVLVKPYRMPELIEKMQIVVRRMEGLSPASPVP